MYRFCSDNKACSCKVCSSGVEFDIFIMLILFYFFQAVSQTAYFCSIFIKNCIIFFKVTGWDFASWFDCYGKEKACAEGKILSCNSKAGFDDCIVIVFVFF